MQIALGFLKAGIIANYFPSNVIKGMLSGIGIIIILKQLPHAFGYDRDVETDLGFDQPNGENAMSSLLSTLDYIHPGATLIAIMSLIIIVIFETKPMKKISRKIPGGLVAVILSILVSEYILKSIPNLTIQSTHLVNVPVPSNFEDFKKLFIFPNFYAISDSRVWVFALTIMAVASIETLLSIEAIDKLDPQKRVTSTNRELMSQGIGNTLSGLIGGLPITSVIVRSSANLNANAKTKISAIFHGVLLLISVLLFPTILLS